MSTLPVSVKKNYSRNTRDNIENIEIINTEIWTMITKSLRTVAALYIIFWKNWAILIFQQKNETFFTS